MKYRRFYTSPPSLSKRHNPQIQSADPRFPILVAPLGIRRRVRGGDAGRKWRLLSWVCQEGFWVSWGDMVRKERGEGEEGGRILDRKKDMETYLHLRNLI
jgi:hypothetical protein